MGKDDRISVRMPSELRQKIGEMSEQEHRSLSSMIVFMLDLAVQHWPYLLQQYAARGHENTQPAEKNGQR